MDVTPLGGERAVGAHPKHLTDLLWHAGAFVIISVFFWIVDATTGADGVRWAPWITLFLAVGLALHGLAWIFVDRPISPSRRRRHMTP